MTFNNALSLFLLFFFALAVTLFLTHPVSQAIFTLGFFIVAVVLAFSIVPIGGVLVRFRADFTPKNRGIQLSEDEERLEGRPRGDSVSSYVGYAISKLENARTVI